MPSADQHPDNSPGDSNEQGAEKKISRHSKDDSGFAHSAKIENRNCDQNADTQKNRVRQQRWNCRHQCSDSRGNAHRSGQDVIREQRGCCQQAGASAQIKARHRVGTAARWIGCNGLSIREINDHQQRDNRRADRNNVMNAKQSEGNQ